jgi:hypothetical protein
VPSLSDLWIEAADQGGAFVVAEGATVLALSDPMSKGCSGSHERGENTESRRLPDFPPISPPCPGAEPDERGDIRPGRLCR